jgi:hypothetical protein
MTAAQKAKVRVLLCGDIPDPRPAVDSKLKLLDEALEDLEMGEGNKFIALRGSLLDAEGQVRKDIFKPRGDIHLNASGTTIVSLRIRRMLEIMMPALNQATVPVPVQTPPAPVQTPAQVQTPPVQTPPAKPQRTRVQAPVPDPAPVVANTPPVVGAPLVAVANAPAVIQAPVVVQHVTVTDQDRVESPMEVEDEDAILERLFFKKYGRALPEKEKEKENDVDNIKFVIDLTDEKDDEEMEVATPVVVVKKEPIEVVAVNNVADVNNVTNESGITDVAKRRSFRLERLELAKARKAITEFGKTLRKTVVIQEKEPENVIADTDSNMSEDMSVNPESGNTVEMAIRTTEAAIAESDAAIAASEAAIATSEANRREFTDEFGDTPIDEFDD